MPDIVIDCSVSASWCLPDETSDASEALLQGVMSGNSHLIVPELWWYEMLNVLRSAVIRDRMTLAGARKATWFLGEIPMERVPLKPEFEMLVLERALEWRLSAYDATYLVLAQTRGATLVTSDRGLLRLRNRLDFIRSPAPRPESGAKRNPPL